MSPFRIALFATLIGIASASRAQFPPPSFVPPGACPPGSVSTTAKPDVSTPAYYFPATTANETRPALPVAITVWRERCGTSDDFALWVRMTPANPPDFISGDPNSITVRPRIVVIQNGRDQGWFGRWGGNTAPNRRFQWGSDLFETGTLFGSRSENLIQMGETFNPYEAFSLHVSYPQTWSESVPPLVYEIPAIGKPGNVADLPAKLEGLWWNPAEPGWGLVLDRNERGTVFAAWLTYDDDGQSTWFVMTNGSSTEPRVVEGSVYATRGTPFSSPARGEASAGEKVGRFSIRFDSADSGELSYTVNGRQGRSPISRFVVRQASGEVCSRNRGIWEVDGLHGWAVSLEGSYFAPCMLHATVLTYDDAGKAMWAFAGLTPFSPGRPSLSGAIPYLFGDIRRPQGTPYGLAHNPAQSSVGPVIGQWASTFEQGANAEFRMRLGMHGRDQSFNIERFRFEY